MLNKIKNNESERGFLKLIIIIVIAIIFLRYYDISFSEIINWIKSISFSKVIYWLKMFWEKIK